MHIPPRCLPGLAAGAVLLLAGLAPPSVQAEASKHGAQVMVFLTDGTVLQGMDRREGHYEYEEDRSFVFMPTGFFFLDDLARRQYFGTKLMQEVKTLPESKEDTVVGKHRDIAIPNPRPVPAVDEVLSIGAWDGRWDRIVKFRSGLATYSVNQHLQNLTPYYVRTDATDHWLWPAVYLTRELGSDAVRDLLSGHPDFAEDKSLPPDVLVERRFKYCDFFAQAGWYDEAENELGRLLAGKPSDKDRDRALAALAAVGRMRCREQFETIKTLHNAGEFKAVRKRLDAFNEKAADDSTLSALHTMRDEYAGVDKSLSEASHLLEDLSKNPGGSANAAALAEATAALRADLRPEILPRLETFLGQAEQAARQQAAGQTPTAGPTELLSLAVTGWLLGNPSAEGKPETAARAWRCRRFLLKYLQPDNTGRNKDLTDYLSGRGGPPATVDEFTQIIPQLPPPAPEEKITDDPITVAIGGAGKVGISYLLQLPPEYRHSRNYPVLFVLHQSGEGPDDMLKRWSEAAAENGFILVAPEWSTGPGGVYGYSEREHAVVLETLRDLRRRFAVDSDRVFLFGLGQGGVMAFDVGLSHPDLFAGVLPMSAGPALFSSRYYRNGQYLPFYIVDGDRSGDMNKHLRDVFEKWVSQYPMIWIQYKGRGVEWYSGELPLMFDWMRNKRREFPLQGLGMAKDAQTKDFTTYRSTDNSFYWATTDAVQARCLNSETTWRNIEPATLAARIDLDTSTIVLGSSGLSQVTLWLGRNGKGESMIDFDKPLTVRWNSNVVWNNMKVAPKLETLLEDLVRRGDRQRLFLAKLEFQGK